MKYRRRSSSVCCGVSWANAVSFLGGVYLYRYDPSRGRAHLSFRLVRRRAR